ncbi:unnamed protein product [Caenorhabditis bovis]|uniref:TIL domain-containing protein n=1 Tax=Caenorhabditis bovis TaxID=2654633 RepID=A0A8S1EE91_9PELO|nr:unnamed protein product [Caenorhabditis bovis]
MHLSNSGFLKLTLLFLKETNHEASDIQAWQSDMKSLILLILLTLWVYYSLAHNLTLNKNGEVMCPENEVYACSEACHTTCKNPINYCRYQCAKKRCVCKMGYARKGNQCKYDKKCSYYLRVCQNDRHCKPGYFCSFIRLCQPDIYERGNSKL